MFVQKSFVKKVDNSIEKKWHVIDADGQILGRLATQIADLLRGKNRPFYTPNTDSGDFVVVVNCDKIALSGAKWFQKRYYRHSGYVGGLKFRTAQQQKDKDPRVLIENAVKGMLPKNILANKQLTKLKIYKGNEHPHAAQNPAPVKI